MFPTTLKTVIQMALYGTSTIKKYTEQLNTCTKLEILG